MRRARETPDFSRLRPASERASRAARGASKKSGTRCELLLRKALWQLGFRYRIGGESLPGKPDIVLPKYSTVIFCDGDFWHGRGLELRLAGLRLGHNAGYWVEKIKKNVARDRSRDAELRAMGWRVIRVWETDILKEPERIARVVASLILTADVEAPGAHARARAASDPATATGQRR